MPVFLALALMSGQPLNLVPDDLPQLPPYAVCLARFRAADRDFDRLLDESQRRASFVPNKDGKGMNDVWLKDPNALRQWREEAAQDAAKARKLYYFWLSAVGARHFIPRYMVEENDKSRWFDWRPMLIRDCRQYLGEALWQKGGWWK
jgi:hypothetical protein